MKANKAKDTGKAEGVILTNSLSYGADTSIPPLTKKRAYRIRRIAEPHIRAHIVKGRPYYFYCRGTDREIYLGDADTILKAVKKRPAILKKGRKE